ncbi:MAG TPA: F0F1 ATP synthase subunit delta [Caldimonas sp.]
MAELATIARPYAEALFKADGVADAGALAAELQGLADVADDPQLRQYADNPKASAEQVFDLVTSVAQRPGSAALSAPAKNLLRIVIDNGRLAALPDIAAQFHALVNARSGTSDALVQSAFPIEPRQLDDVVAALERRFGRKLNASVVIDPELIGGIRVVVGDEVLDTSIKAKLEQMKAALAA